MIGRAVTILEGPDGSGKTTLAKALHAAWDVPVVHHGPYKGLDGQTLASVYAASMGLGVPHVLLDRSWISETIYGRVFRNGVDRCVGYREALEGWATTDYRGVVVVCLPPWERVREVWAARRTAAGEELFAMDDAQLRSVFALFSGLLPTDLPVVPYDYTRHTVEQLIHAVGDARRLTYKE